jgi:hypothetical protein
MGQLRQHRDVYVTCTNARAVEREGIGHRTAGVGISEMIASVCVADEGSCSYTLAGHHH